MFCVGNQVYPAQIVARSLRSSQCGTHHALIPVIPVAIEPSLSFKPDRPFFKEGSMNAMLPSATACSQAPESSVSSSA